MKTIQFWVPGIPATAGSKMPFTFADKKTGKIRASMAPANKRQKPWMSMVAMVAAEKYSGPALRGAVFITIDFVFPRPKSHFRSGKFSDILKDSAPSFHIQKPDRGKLVRAIEDALTGVIWHDDSQVYKCTSIKTWSKDGYTGALVTIFADTTH